MPSYIEGDKTITTVIDNNPITIKPILFTTYKTITKYDITITYEDDTTKVVEIVQNDKHRPYKFIYKKDGQLLSIIGVPTLYEINEGNKFCDFENRVMDASDLLFEVDSSTQFESTKARFYLKDIRDIIDLSIEGFPDPDDPMDIFPVTMYPIYLAGHSCQNPIKYVLPDDSLILNLTSEVTKNGEPLLEDQYNDFKILSVDFNKISDTSDITFTITENNKFSLEITEDLLDTEIKVILKYFITEINHPVFDEFTIIPTRQQPPVVEDLLGGRQAVSTQDMQYIGDGLKTGLGNDLTPGYKPYKYR